MADFDSVSKRQELLRVVLEGGSMDEEQARWCDGPCLGRYLRARGGNIR